MLKRKRTTERTNITKFRYEINKAIADTEIDYEYNRTRLQDELDRLTTLADAIHDFLSDTEYVADVEMCEEYIDVATRAILKGSRIIGEKLSTSVSNFSLAHSTTVVTAPLPTPVSHCVKLPAIKLDPFTGDVEKWSRFWEQFQSSVDTNPSLKTIDKHVFLRGEPMDLVEGTAVKGNAYEETKRILISRYGGKNRIIQAHLDYLEALRPIVQVTPEALNVTYIGYNRRIQALRALGENVDDYGRMLAPKLLRAFPDICRRWTIHAKREKISEGHINSLMEFRTRRWKAL